ncbi:beta-glucosidase/6-phospho-beta-glucosidase/beta-galactosidase [Actinoalloteichus sp. GBA129-24]|uniref:Beta-glucosidase/6-phospho-beta-glucosidase/beta-galactosidase n=2 Tax=Actinoalloteichus TaxID=65496 RepID=A0AAC9LG50_9PSEU|nr:beta-glucosidase/6-phospho-beta-glucosidase/beta-galactosidase [Actinoalloteichus fjordicus]APU22802.1 beta-glucosidase/6-phospho-beta-glucosidase/beta-galactosidase [Actinoalloteichus sp. GBA129-24]
MVTGEATGMAVGETTQVAGDRGWWWGAASSSVQDEGASPRDDWSRWEEAGKAPASGAGTGFRERYREDLRLIRSLGVTRYRTSVSWARVVPEPGRVDRAEVEHVRRVLTAGREAGLQMWLTLLHSAIPRWFAEEGGFAGPTAAARWREWVELVAADFGGEVDGWMPINNPGSYAMKAYLNGTFPPGVRDLEVFARALEVMHRCDAQAAVMLREATGLPVTSNQSLAPLWPADDSAAAVAATARFDALLWSWLPAAAAFDQIGFSYYYGAAIAGDGSLRPWPADRAPGPLGYVPWADGLGIVLDRLHTALPGRELVMAEVGYGGNDDAARGEYLRAVDTQLRAARARGMNLTGAYLWTPIDNYEWLAGYDVPFGVLDAHRRERSSARVLRELIG